MRSTSDIVMDKRVFGKCISPLLETFLKRPACKDASYSCRSISFVLLQLQATVDVLLVRIEQLSSKECGNRSFIKHFGDLQAMYPILIHKVLRYVRNYSKNLVKKGQIHSFFVKKYYWQSHGENIFCFVTYRFTH